MLRCSLHRERDEFAHVNPKKTQRKKYINNKKKKRKLKRKNKVKIYLNEQGYGRAVRSATPCPRARTLHATQQRTTITTLTTIARTLRTTITTTTANKE